jgi:anti-sigma factor RsiW
MNCRKIQERIMTDYMDGEASAAIANQIKEHLAACAGCAAFEQRVRQKAVQPFKNVEPVQPPGEIWQRIQDAIKEEEPEYAPSFLERLFDFLRESFVVRRPAYALATAFTVILVTIVYLQSPFRQQMLVKDYLGNKSAFMVAMNKAPNGDLDKVADFNTAIEEYLF